MITNMTQEDARRLLDRTGILRNACDLDLLIFFVRHPHSLLSSELLATFLGYDLKAIADSLEILLAGGLLHRKQTPAHAARLYILATPGANHESFASLLEFASTRQGRLALKEALTGPKDSPIATNAGGTQIRPASLPLGVRREQGRLHRRARKGRGR